MKQIELTQGKVTLVDDADWARLNGLNWCAHSEGPRWYAVRSVRLADGRKGIERMHRAVIQTDAPAIDHINGDGLDNRRENLRPATKSQNGLNARLSARNKSGRTGVHWDKARSQWVAYLTVNRQRRHLGRFDTMQAAIAARALAILQLELEKEKVTK